MTSARDPFWDTKARRLIHHHEDHCTMPLARSFLLTLTILGAVATAAAAQIPADLELTDLGIAPATPLALRHANDGTGRLFIVERGGSIVIYEPGTGLLGTAFLTIGEVDTFFEGGLLGLAFHPDYSSNGYFYVNYTRDGSPLETVIARYEVSAGDSNVADGSSAVEILTLDQPAGNHNGGDLHFGPDGYLYIGFGDGGSSSSTAQDMGNLLGKMLRIDPCDTPVCAVGYTIPPSNPFVGAGNPLDEIWASGFRNPYRWSFDRLSGDIMIADVGQSSREEVSVEPGGSAGGLNYGWNCREGDIPFTGCAGTFVEPKMVYDHTGGNISITGGYRYRGCIPGLRGTYIFADFGSARVFFGTEDTPGNWSFTEWDNLSGSVFGFGEGEDGEVYLLQGSSVLRFDSDSTCEPSGIFSDGFESGDTSLWN